MGLPVPDLPDDYGFGVDCPACHEADETPNYVFVTFTGITTCPGKPLVPNNQPIACKQIPLTPCLWIGYLYHHGRNWRAVYRASIPDNGGFFAFCALHAWDPPGDTAFYGPGAECDLEFDNVNTCVGGHGGEGGSAIVTSYIDPIIIALTSCYHFATIPGVLHEKMDVGMDHAIYKLNHRSDKTNVLIYLDKEELELPW